MANINSIKTDLQKETDGVWMPYSLDIAVKVARARNSKYQEVLRARIDPLKKGIREESISMDELNELLLEVRAETILLDWKNIEDENDKAIPYSVEQAIKFFKDPELKDFYNFVVTISESSERYKKDLVKEAEKN